jgi:hypothetical protein
MYVEWTELKQSEETQMKDFIISHCILWTKAIHIILYSSIYDITSSSSIFNVFIKPLINKQEPKLVWFALLY